MMTMLIIKAAIFALVLCIFVVEAARKTTGRGTDEAPSTPVDLSVDFSKKSYYELLDMPKDGSVHVLKRTYRNAALIYHPDRFLDPAQKQLAEKVFLRVSKAFKVLSDPMTRMQYDKLVERGVLDFDAKKVERLAFERGTGVFPEDDIDGFHDMSDLGGGDAEMPGSDVAINPEEAGALLGWYVIGTVLLCVLPVVYGLMTSKKKKPNMKKLAETAGVKSVVSASERESIEQEIRMRKQEQARLAAEERAAEEERQRRVEEAKRQQKEARKAKETAGKKKSGPSGGGNGGGAPLKYKGGGWSQEESTALEAAMNKYGEHERNREDLIANYVNTTVVNADGLVRSKRDVKAQVEKRSGKKPAAAAVTAADDDDDANNNDDDERSMDWAVRQSERRTKAVVASASEKKSSASTLGVPPGLESSSSGAPDDSDGDWEKVGPAKKGGKK